MLILYLIKIFAALHSIAVRLLPFLLVPLFICVVVMVFSLLCGDISFDDLESFKSSPFRKIIKKLTTGVIILFAFTIFLPTEKESYKIFGVGLVVDYVLHNDTIKALPDKAVKALEKLIDSDTDKPNSKNDKLDKDSDAADKEDILDDKNKENKIITENKEYNLIEDLYNI